jgi:AcrR family transcriptional regulator
MPKKTRTSKGNTRSPETHAAILKAARSILNESGYSGFTIEILAKKSGAGKPTIYRWWPNKTSLFMEVYKNESSIQVNELGSVEKELVSYIKKLWKFWRETECGQAFRSIIAEVQGNEFAMTQLRDEFMPERRKMLREILERGIKRKELNKEIDINIIIDQITGFNWYRLLTNQITEKNRVIEKYIFSLLNGIYK